MTTPAEIIYQRRLAVLAHADKSKNVAETVPALRRLSDPLLRVEGRGRSLRSRRLDAQGPAPAPDARQRPPPMSSKPC